MRSMMMIVAAPLALLSACADTADTGEDADAAAVVASDEALEAIGQVEASQQAAFNADDVAGATAVYASDAQFFNAGAPLASGSAAIRAAFESMIGDPNSAIELTRSGSWVADSGDLAVTMANYTFTYTGEDGEPMRETGVNQTVWRKQGDGSWKIVSDFNGAAGEPALVTDAGTAAGAAAGDAADGAGDRGDAPAE